MRLKTLLRGIKIAALCSVLFCFLWALNAELLGKEEVGAGNSATELAVNSGMAEIAWPEFLASDGPSRHHNVTLVTAYFPLVKSKHSGEAYMSWISNFLTTIELTPIVIFTTSEAASKMREMRLKCANAGPTIYLEFKDIWELPWLRRPIPQPASATSALNTWKQVYEQHMSLDRESAIHSKELYAIWNSKTWMLSSTAQQNPFHSEYFFWVDVGSFRDPSHRLRQWPNVAAVERTVGTEDKVVVALISEVAPDDLSAYGVSDGPIDRDVIEAGFFGGSAAAVRWWHTEYTSLHDRFLSSGNFVGKEQPLMNALLFLNPSCCVGFESFEAAPACGDQWFYYLFALASNEERPPGCQQLPHWNVFVDRRKTPTKLVSFLDIT